MNKWQVSQKHTALKARAERRVANTRYLGKQVWIVNGDSKLGDALPSYRVSRTDGSWYCTCYDLPYGDKREEYGCSHILAAKMVGEREVPVVGEVRSVLGGDGMPALQPRDPSREELVTKPLSSYPTPSALGLPRKFKSWRGPQLDALEKVLETDARFILLDAPTGSGKSLIAAALQRISGQPMLYVVHTKQLQDQLARDFPYAQVLKGRANYPTANDPAKRCDQCMRTGKHSFCNLCGEEDFAGKEIIGSDISRCPYQIAKRNLLSADLGVVNMALFLTEANYVGQLSAGGKEKWNSRGWTVLDEGDLCELSLMEFREVYVARRVIQELRLKPPERKTVESSWKDWAIETQKYLEEEQSRRWKTWDHEFAKMVEQLSGRLAFFAGNIDRGGWTNCTMKENWEGGPWIFKPAFIRDYAQCDLWRHGNRFLMMSATILSPHSFARDLGLDMRDVKFIQLPSVFPADRRPIYYQPSARLSHKEFATSGPKVVADLVKLLQGMPEKKILVHTVSYRLAELVLSSPLRYRAISYTQPGQRVEALEGFKSAPPGAILVACSMGRGVDLPYDSCDVVVILKIAYPNLADPQVARRLHSGSGGQNWYIVQTIREIVQASGRAMRFEDDRCEVYILDAMFEELYERYRKVFPPWWREALRLPAKSRVVRPSEPPR